MSQSQDWGGVFDLDTRTAHALAAFARAEGISMHMTIPEGMRWYLRTKRGLDPSHVERVYHRIHRQDVPLSVQGIRDQVDAAIAETATT